jgi:ABC-type transport system substrate-binding protein
MPEWLGRLDIPSLDKPPEEKDWDLTIFAWRDFDGNPRTSFVLYGFLEEGDFRWIEYDPVYEEMWKDMSRTVDSEVQEERLRQVAKYLYDGAYGNFIYSPITLYAVNKEVHFVPQKSMFLLLKETSVTDDHWSLRGENQQSVAD